MKIPFIVLPVFLCLFLLNTSTKASTPISSDLDFLEQYYNHSLVEDGLMLTMFTTELSFATLVSFSLWYGVCKAPEIVSGFVGKPGISAAEKATFEKTKTDFCLQMASTLTTTEVVLAGHVSPWPLDYWWQSVRFSGLGLALYGNYKALGYSRNLPITAFIYLSSEAGARTAVSAAISESVRAMGTIDISLTSYTYNEYTVLSIFSGLILGALVYEVLIMKGVSPMHSNSAFFIVSAASGEISAIISTSTLTVDELSGVAAGVVSGVGAGVMAIAIAESVTLAGGRAGGRAGAMVIAIAETITLAGAGAVTIGVTEAITGIGARTLIGAGASAGAVAGASLTLISLKITGSNFFIQGILTLAPAMLGALLNSYSSHTVYGKTIEEALCGTDWVLWNKFHMPLSYLSSMLN